jgi:hypothetical protein
MNSIRAAALVALALAGCNLNNPGFDAPAGELAFPVALTLSASRGDQGSQYLYVVNSNSDLRYNGGSVQTYDLDELAEVMRRGECKTPDLDDGEEPAPADAGMDAGEGEPPIADGGLDPDAEPPLDGGDVGEDGAVDAQVDARIEGFKIDAGSPVSGSRTAAPKLCDGRGGMDPESDPCCLDTKEGLAGLPKSEISIDSYATGLAASPDGAHLYVPLRANRLVFVDVDDEGELSCGAATGRCRRGPEYEDVSEYDDEVEVPALPTAVLTGSFADLKVKDRDEEYFVATAHERGEVSLFAMQPDGYPRFLHAISPTSDDVRTAARAVSLRLDDGFLLVSSAEAGRVFRVGARTDLPANDARDTKAAYLYPSAPLVINGLSFTADIRDVQPDSRELATGIPRHYYALLRGKAPQLTLSVAFLELDPISTDGRLARVIDAVPVRLGVSKLVQAEVGSRHLLFASCYDAAEIHIIDADARRTVTVIRDLLGPYDMQLDSARQLLYVSDMRASVIRVVDLRTLFQGIEAVPRVVATLGKPYVMTGQVQ